MSSAEPKYNKLIIHPSIERIKGMSYQPRIMNFLDDSSDIGCSELSIILAVSSEKQRNFVLGSARPNEVHYSQQKLSKVEMKLKCFPLRYTPLTLATRQSSHIIGLYKIL